MRDRHLAGPEAAQLHPIFQIVEALIDPRLEVGRRHDDPIFALEACGGSFSDLHGITLHGSLIAHIVAAF